MPHFDFIWTPENIAHILEHGVSLEEAEDVVCFPDFTSTNSRNGRKLAYGEAATGKYLKVVYEFVDEITIYVVTAFEPEPEF
ncbi:BrnT family toxin [Rubinisphaera brasiliensis]|uniref:DUF4258 domain-containing protein n=1 Tax=Rubinisphaera brasiliensis (strain ATCC 49424 / DSM 5305 / JCM 21570 / IAM 15109 / NBRC 103401 / IFAM 1448) TaxID=756272 RepID=F0SIC2_RUBBR|nr:hypothetical protein [Rubinisphaera brasiliensis]ADY58511.1 hypothetical protein Plabr_0888 [Rubinisphaera brasiliensis DSM 5305]